MKGKRSAPLTKAALVIVCLLLIALGAPATWGAIGVYKWSATTTVPSTVSYMLNLDADDTTDGWSVKVEIVPSAGGAAVRTYSYLSPDPMTLRGAHSVVWDGLKDDANAAPAANYKAVITAKAAPVTGTNLVGKWTNAPDTYYATAVNKDPNSPYFGYIYLSAYRTSPGGGGIAMMAPDGSGYFKSSLGKTWAGSAPWGIAVDGSGNVWLGNRSGNYTGINFVWKPDLSAEIAQSKHLDYDRATEVYGPTNNVYLADFSSTTTSVGGAYGRISSLKGDATTWTAATLTNEWKSAIGTSDQSWCLVQGKIFDEGNANGPVIYVPARTGVQAGALGSGALCKYIMDWTTGQPIPDPLTPTIPEAWVNTNLTLGLAVDVAPDGLTMGMTRNISGGTVDARPTASPAQPLPGVTPTNAFVTFPLASAGTITATDPDYKVYGFTMPPGGSSGTTWFRLQFFRYDALGNVIANYGSSNPEAQQSWWGFFAPPDNGSTNTRTTGEIVWLYPQPTITSTNSPVDISSCVTNATATATVNVNCADGIDKVASVTIDFTVLAKAGQGTKTLTGGGTGNNGTWSTSFGVGANLRAGDYNCPITITSTHPEVSPTTGTLVVHVTGATISGQVTNSKTGWPIPNATVTATTGTPPDFTTTTDASGNYTLNVNPAAYAVSATSNRYGAMVGGAASVSVSCGQSKTQDLQMDPMDVHTATGGCYYYGFGRGSGDTVCVVGSVMRLPNQGTGTQGFNGYYYIYDKVFGGVQNGVRIYNYTGQPTLKEGDLVVVEGVWNAPAGFYQGSITPSRLPQIVGTGTQAIPEEYYRSYFTTAAHPYGGLYHVKGVVSDPQPTGVAPFGPYFMITAPASPTDPTPAAIRVRVDTPESSGLTTFPTAGSTVNVNGVLSYLDIWQADTLSVGKATDVYLISDDAASISAAKALDDDAKVGLVSRLATVTAGGGLPDGMVYIEDSNRTSGIRIQGTLPTGLGKIGTGDLVDVHGLMKTTAQGERYIEADILQRHSLDNGASGNPLEAIGMNNRDAGKTNALGMFVKVWGVVGASGTDYFMISDGSAVPIKVMCGALMTKPASGTVRVRGVMSKDADGPVLYMRNEQVDWTAGDAAIQPLPFPGSFGYARDFLVLGPFADAGSTDETYRLDNDFISAATGGAITEFNLSTAAPPSLGGTLAGKTWTRSNTSGDHVVFAPTVPPAEQTSCTFYAHIWVYSSMDTVCWVQVGSDDSSKVIVTPVVEGTQDVYRTNPVMGRGESWGQDLSNAIMLTQGWTSVLLKCENGTGPSGMDIHFISDTPVAGWGATAGVPGLGYLLSKP